MWLNSSSGPIYVGPHTAVPIQKSNIEFGESYLLATITAYRWVCYKHLYIYGAAAKLLDKIDNMMVILLSAAMKFGAVSEGVDEGKYSPFALTCTESFNCRFKYSLNHCLLVWYSSLSVPCQWTLSVHIHILLTSSQSLWQANMYIYLSIYLLFFRELKPWFFYFILFFCKQRTEQVGLS